MKKRELFDVLLSEKDSRKISLILGSRQVGKTTLLKQLHSAICSDTKGVFLDLDVISNYEKVSNYENFINFITLLGYKQNKGGYFYMFLDEFQRYPGFSIVLKNVYDNNSNIKIFATGSSSIKIKDEIQESLAGRKRIHYLYPLSFSEFIDFKGNEEAKLHLTNVENVKGTRLSMPLLNGLLNEFMIYGGYPEVVLTKNKNDKIQVLKDIFDLYVKKDIIEYLNINRVLNVKTLIEILSVNNGQKIKYEELAQVCSLKEYEVRNYLEILKETFLVYELRPFFTNKNKEIVKIPKVYFIDSGVRNFFLNNFNELNIRNDSGFLFEGFVLSELIKSGIEKLKYWQNKNKREVDFILDIASEHIPIEVKYKSVIKSKDFLGLAAYKKQYVKETVSFIVAPLSQYYDDKYNTKVVLPFVIRDLVNRI